MSITYPVGEGWAWPSHRGTARAHYYRAGRCLCGAWTEATHRPKASRRLDVDRALYPPNEWLTAKRCWERRLAELSR